MASKPPFQVEETDSDFFDNLMSDDDNDNVDSKLTARSSSLNSTGLGFGDGNESLQVKAFANLSVNDPTSSQTGVDKFGVNHSTEFGIQANGDLHDVIGEIKEGITADGAMGESKSVIESATSFEFAGIHDLNTQNVGSEDFPVSNLSENDESVASGVKEVQWTAFHADSAQNGGSGFGSFSDFFSELGEKADASSEVVASNLLTDTTPPPSGGDTHESVNLENSDLGKYQDGYGAGVQRNSEGKDLASIQYWESLYPGWKIDPSTGQWYQVNGHEAGPISQGNAESVSSYSGAPAGGKAEVSYFQQSYHQPVGEAVAESDTIQNVTNWSTNGVSLPNQETTYSGALDGNQSANQGYPSHMVFDPQYPGWYYDTIVQDWKSLEAYHLSSNLTTLPLDQSKQNGFGSSNHASIHDYQKAVDANGQANGVQGPGNQGQLYNQSGSLANCSQQDSNAWHSATGGSNVWQQETVVKNESPLSYLKKQEESCYSLNFSGNNQFNQQVPYDYGRVIPSNEQKSKNQQDFSAISTPQTNFPPGSFSQQYNQPRMDLSEHKLVSNDYYSNQNSAFSQQLFDGSQQLSSASITGRLTAGRPPHALVAFGFGGKLIVAKYDNSIATSSFGSQIPVGSSINVLDLKEVVLETAGGNAGLGASDYFSALCHQSFPGPLTGGRGGLKELNKWLDKKIQNSDVHYHKEEVLRLLLSLLKLSCQYYGKLRSPIGSDTGLKENDIPEVAVARLLASTKNFVTQFSENGAIARCLQKVPSEGQMLVTAAEVQNLLVSGRKTEALHCAQEGQLWGPAIVLAAQLGEQFYRETITQMAIRQLVPGSPLRTLCLLIAGQQGDVFSSDTPVSSSMIGAVNVNQQPAQFGSTGGMLGDWEEHLAVITANRTKDDELVLTNLGDCLWKERSDVIAAHICYLVAEVNFEPYSDTARLCLLGSDHWKFPRTYASPEAIQRTEIYEYSKVIGNSQFTLLPFQPYKFVYAHMLAEVGRLSDALKYCQAVLKSLNIGRAPEVENIRQSVAALEERIKAHQQGGFSSSLAPTKLVGRFFGLIDSAAHHVVGGGKPPVPSTSGGSPLVGEHYQVAESRVAASRSTMAIPSMMNSAPVEPVTEGAADSSAMNIHTRSVSEPDFSRSPRQGQTHSSKEASSPESKGETSSRWGKSRLGRFGFGFGSQLLQKTVGLVLRPRQGRQAKLGETNKYYYNEKLKSWVEEGAEPPNEETALPPPPTSATFQNNLPDYNLNSAFKSEGTLGNGSPAFKSPPVEQTPGMPPLPPTSNQYSARGRMGTRSRYVDPFNKGGGGNQTNLFQPPSLPSSNPSSTTANPKFFIPTPIKSSQDTHENVTDNKQDALDGENVSVRDSKQDALDGQGTASAMPNGLSHPLAPPVAMQRFGSMDSISSKATAANSSFSATARRTASWSGRSGENMSSPPSREVKPLGEVLGMPPSNFLPSDTSSVMSPGANGVSFDDDLHKVEF